MHSLRLVVVAALLLFPCWAEAQAYSAGTGFFIAPDGYVATCYHNVAGSDELKVRDSSGQIYAASLVLTDVANDLAVIRANVKGSPVLPVRRSSDVRKGDTVFTIGYPNIDMQGTDAKVTEGIISSIAGIGGEPNSFQISVAVQPGNSGGPLFDSSGAVVGIVSSKLAQINALKRSGSLPENVNYAVKSNYLLELVATIPMLSAKLIVVPQKAAPERLPTLVARVERATVLVIAKHGDQQAPPPDTSRSGRLRSFDEEMTSARRTPDPGECLNFLEAAEKAADAESSSVSSSVYFSRKAAVEAQRNSCLTKSGRYAEGRAAMERRNEYLNKARTSSQ